MERRKQREEEKERKRLENEEKKQQRLIHQQLRRETRQQKQGKVQKTQQTQQTALDLNGDETKEEDEIIVSLPSRPKTPTAAQSSSQLGRDGKKKEKIILAPITPSQRPSLVVESPREMVVAFQPLGRPQRNTKRPAWLNDCDIRLIFSYIYILLEFQIL